MTIGLFVPLTAAVGDMVIALMMLRQLRLLPTRTEPGFDEAAIAQKRKGLRSILAASVATPVLLYAVLNLAVPEIGAIPLW